MTLHEFGQDAIEGKWRKDDSTAREYANSVGHLILLDKKAWEAVGEVRGWGTEWDSYGVHYYMHAMVDAVLADKTLDEFLLTL